MTESTEFLLVRHGQSTMNIRPEIICGRSSEIPLTKWGEMQAHKAGRFMLGNGILEPHMADVTDFWTSPAQRALETGRLALAAAGTVADITEHHGLQEMSQGIYEGQDRSKVYTEALVEEIIRKGKHYRNPDGESMHDTGQRGIETLLDIASQSDASRQLIFTHGHFIKCLIGEIWGWPQSKIRKELVPNGSISKLLLSKGEWFLKDFAIKTH